MRSPSKATLARTLNLNGYATGAFGKMHQTPNAEVTPAGPFTHWPTNEGFEKFYGFLGGETDQFVPNLIDGTTYIDVPGTEEEGYHFSEDIVDKATEWIRGVRTWDQDRPWFAYLPFGATHAPFHVPRSWRDRYRGQFEHGWDEQREQTLARQKELGIVPEDAELAPVGRGRPALGRAVRGREAGRGAADGGLRRVRRAHRRPGRPPHRRARAARRARQHDRLLHPGRQRRLLRGRHRGHPQRDAAAQRPPGHDRADPRAARRHRRAHDVPALQRGLGAGDGHAVPVGQAGRLALRRHPQRAGRALAGRDRRQGCRAPPVAPRHRRDPDDPRGRGSAAPDHVDGVAAGPDPGHLDARQPP